MLQSRTERGQVLVLVLIAMVGLMGFAALVVDGGHLYSERRRSQAAADSAALAAARSGADKKNDTQIAKIVSDQANANGFFNGANGTVVTYNHPPVSGEYAGNDEYYQVFITEEIQPIFSQFVFQGKQTQTVQAVARARPASPLTGDNAMMAVAQCGCGALIDLLGNVKMTIRGGNIFSNDDGDKSGNAGDIYVYADTDPKVTTLGDVVTVGSWGNKAKIHANFISDAGPINLDAVPTPYCPTSNWYDPDHKVNYYVWKNTVPTSPMQPGIHCVYGTIDLKGGTKTLEGDGVLLVLLNGGITTTGNAYINLSRASNLIDKNGNQWGGMVIFAPKSNKSAWDFKGNSETVFNGTLFAPGTTCDIGGTPGTGVNRGAFICGDFKIHGDPDIKITYEPTENWQLPPSLSLIH